MANLIDLEHWVTQLKSECPLLCERVFESLDDVETALSAVTFYGSPLVILSFDSDSAEPCQLTTYTRQQHHNRVLVRLLVQQTKNQSDRLSNLSARLVRDCRQEILTALIGWCPIDGVEPVHYSAGKQARQGDVLIFDHFFMITDYLEQTND